MVAARRRKALPCIGCGAAALLALLLVSPRGAEAQPAAAKPAAFAGVVGWQVRLQVEYENERGTFSEHAVSVWTGTLYAGNQPPQGAGGGELSPQLAGLPYWTTHNFLNPPLLEWYGDVEVTADYDSAWTTDHPSCRDRGEGHGARPNRIYLSISDAGYTLRSSGGGITADIAEHCEPPGGDNTYKDQPVDYSVTIDETDALPGQGWRLAGSVSRSGEGTNGRYRQTVTWEFTPVENENFVCGPDVTADLDATLRQIETWFGALERRQKIEQCETLHWPPSGQRAWDIRQFFFKEAYWLDQYTQGERCCMPGDAKTDENEDPASCKHSVRYKGVCVLAGTLNYAAWGLMNKLCHDEAVATTGTSERYRQLMCVVRRGACPSSQPGGVAGDQALAEANRQCSAETGTDEAVTPSEEECRWGALDPAGWDPAAMMQWILRYKTTTLQGQDTTGPIAVAVSSYVGGVDGTAAIANRAFCQGECRGPLVPRSEPAPFSWTWLPGHER